MLINKITDQEKSNLQKKFEVFDRLLSENKPVLGFIKKDPTLFAYFFFKDDFSRKFKALPWQDKFLNSPSKRRLLACSRQIGKSTVTSILAIHKAYFNPNFTILVVSRTKEQAMELVYRMRRFMKASNYKILWKETQRHREQENKKEIILRCYDTTNQGYESRIIVVPATDAALGYTANIVIGDEAAYWENGDYIFKNVLEPTTTWTNGDIYLLSTPAGRQGFFWESYNMEDIWEIYQFDYTMNPYLTDSMIAEKRRIHTVQSWAMQYEAKFVSVEDAYFTPIEIANSIHSEASRGFRGEKNICIGVDFGKIHDNCVIVIGTILNPEKPFYEQVIRVIDRRVKPLGTDYAIVLEELKSLNSLVKPFVFVLDVTSGEVPSDILRASGCPTEPFKFTIQSKISIMNNLKILMQQGRIQIPNAKELIEQLEVFQCVISKENQDRMKLHALAGYHDDEVDSLALMAYGFTKGFGYVSSEYVSSILVSEHESLTKTTDDFMSFLNKNSNQSPNIIL